jgi:hypothetical protein
VSGPQTFGGMTQCAHIIPDATFFGVELKENNAQVLCLGFLRCIEALIPPTPQLDYSAPILTILQGFRSDISSFNGEKVHSLMNVTQK